MSQRSQSDTRTASEVVQQLRSIAVHSLARMYRPEEQLFAFRLWRNSQGEVLEGVSRRYTTVVLIGLVGEDQHIAAEVLGNHSREDIYKRLLDDIEESQEFGEIALTTQAARMYQHPRACRAVDTPKRMNPASRAEMIGSLVDTERNVIWRRVGWHEPG